MIFSTVIFLFYFLPITLLLYYIVPGRFKNTVLLLCSLVFYSWGEVRYFPIMLALILINYLCGFLIERFDASPKLRRLFLILSIVGSLSMLLFFKYTDFFIRNINSLFSLSVPLLKLTLPLGISFYTFQTMSYSIDVYRRGVKAERNIINFGAYVVMFPQLIAGPIVKYSDIQERLHVLKGRITLSRINEGVTLFIFGLGKKVLIADGVGALWTELVGVNGAGGIGLANASTPLVWLAVIAYSLQLYFDFSGYSMMGIGLGKMLGFDFPQNFNLPYISKSITEFWRRWHITLSSWFREYVYIPLGGNRKGLKRQILNLFIVWFLTGFWHGADWNFILWGLYYFTLLMIEKVWLLKKLESGKVWPHIYTLFFVVVGWAIFVANDGGAGLGLLLSKMFIPSAGIGPWYYLRNYGVVLLAAIIFSTRLPEKIYEKIKQHQALRIAVLAVIVLLALPYMANAGYSPFLYFRF